MFSTIPISRKKNFSDSRIYCESVVAPFADVDVVTTLFRNSLPSLCEKFSRAYKKMDAFSELNTLWDNPTPKRALAIFRKFKDTPNVFYDSRIDENDLQQFKELLLKSCENLCGCCNADITTPLIPFLT